MNKKLFVAFRLLFSVFTAMFFVLSALPGEISSLELVAKSDMMTRLMQGAAANHTIQFRAASTINSGTIGVHFGDVVADKKNVSASDVNLLYGASGAEAEYLVQESPGDGIWGAAFSSNGSSTIVTLTYPTTNGVPINVGNTVIIHIGTDQRVDTPPPPASETSQTNSTRTATVVVSDSTSESSVQNNLISYEQLDPGQLPDVIEIVPLTTENVNKLLAVPVPNFAAIQEFIKDQLVKFRNLITNNKPFEIRPESQQQAVVITTDDTGSGWVAGGSGTDSGAEGTGTAESGVASAPTSSSWTDTTQQQTAAPSEEQAYRITLAEPKAEVIDTRLESTVSLERVDGGRLDIFVPADAVPETKNISIDVKPLTIDQSKEWSKLRIDEEKRPMLAQVYVVTATDDKAQVVTEFQKPIKYNFHFTSKEIEQQGIDPHTLAVYSWDAATETLQREPSKVDLDSNTVTANIYHLTTFLLLGEPKKAVDSRPAPAPAKIAVIPSVILPRIAVGMQGESFGLTNAATAETISFAGNDFFATPNTRLSFCIPRRVFPKPIREITLTADAFPKPFVLNKEKDCYAAHYVTPTAGGKKSLAIKMVYADDQVQISRYRVNIAASELQVKVLSTIAPRVEQARAVAQEVNKKVEEAVVTTQPVLQTTAIATGAGVTALNPTIVTNSMNWYHYFNHFFSAILSALGLRKRRRPWGVVYNAITKIPIDLAIVRLINVKDKKLLETQVTDKEGRFSFIAPPGDYTLQITKPPFLFPSRIIQGGKDGEYAGVYHDDVITISESQKSMNLSIPIDPPNPQEGKARKSLFESIKNFARNYSGISLVVSLVVSIVLALYAPSFLNSTLLLVNSLFVISQSLLSTRKEKEWGTIFDTLTFEPIPLAAISIINAKEGKLLRTRLSDYLGRFSFLSPPGEYALVVMKKDYVFPPARAVKNKKFNDLYFGGTFVVKKKKALVKANVPMEKRAVEQVQKSKIKNKNEN